MSVFHSASELFELGEAECLDLLASRRVGRIAFLAESYPVVLPVNYAVDGGTIVFRTDTGAKSTHIPLGKVAFEVDDIDEPNGEGWDVLVQGHGEDITDTIDLRSEALRSLAIKPFAPGPKLRWIRIVPTEVSGRRVLAR